MDEFLFFFILIFVIINIIQTWLIFACKLLIKGGIIIGAMEAVEIPVMLFNYLRRNNRLFNGGSCGNSSVADYCLFFYKK